MSLLVLLALDPEPQQDKRAADDAGGQGQGAGGDAAPAAEAVQDGAAAKDVDAEAKERQREERARRLLEEAKRRRAEADEGRDVPGVKVDKYFGTKLPPVCERLGCYLTDDGTRFYCVNSACQKHKKRATKHTRRGRPTRGHFVYFRCPKCESKRVEMNLFSNEYTCRTCKYVWQR